MSIKIGEVRCNIQQSNSIVGKIISKSTINKFRNGEGQLFSMDIEDNSGKIRMVFFNELANKFYSFIQVSFLQIFIKIVTSIDCTNIVGYLFQFSKWYTIDGFRFVTARGNANLYEIHCTENTKISILDKKEVVAYAAFEAIDKMDVNEITSRIYISKCVNYLLNLCAKFF